MASQTSLRSYLKTLKIVPLGTVKSNNEFNLYSNLLKMNEHFVNFYDFTFLYPKYTLCSFISSKDLDMYIKFIKSHLRENYNNYNNGDVLFLGSTGNNQYLYSFASVVKNDNYIGYNGPTKYPEESFSNNFFYFYALRTMREWFYNTGKMYFDSKASFSESFEKVIINVKSNNLYLPKHITIDSSFTMEQLSFFGETELTEWIENNSNIDLKEHINTFLRNLILQTKINKLVNGL